MQSITLVTNGAPANDIHHSRGHDDHRHQDRCGHPRGQRADARRNRAKVLVSAQKLFAEQGLDAQIDEIARDAGVGVGTVYRHFLTKEDLLQALADERFVGLAQAADAALEARISATASPSS